MFYANVPGLKICTPATPRDAKGLLKTAVRDDNPVLVLECELFYSHKGEIEEEDVDLLIPLGEAETKRGGSDVTIICYAQTVPMALVAAEQLAGRKSTPKSSTCARSSHSIGRPCSSQSQNSSRRDRRTGSPVLRSRRGNRLPNSTGNFDELDAPVQRVAQKDVPMPYNERLEKAVLPSVEKIVAAVKKIC